MGKSLNIDNKGKTVKYNMFAKVVLVGSMLAVSAHAAETRTGIISEISASSTDKLMLKLNHSSSNLCGNNSATTNAYIKISEGHYDAVKPLIVAAFMSGKEVELVLKDTGSECRIDKVTVLN